MDTTPARLLSLAAYQDGAIVSKSLMGKKTGNVTLFAFDKGQELSEHTAPFDAMVCVLDGAAAITVDGKAMRVDTGEMVILPANIPHAVAAEERFIMMLTMIRS